MQIIAENIDPKATTDKFSSFLKQLVDKAPVSVELRETSALIEYNSFEDACDTLEVLDGFAFMGRRIEATFAEQDLIPKFERRKMRNRRLFKESLMSKSVPIQSLWKSSPQSDSSLASSYGSIDFRDNPIMSHYTSLEPFSVDDLSVSPSKLFNFMP